MIWKVNILNTGVLIAVYRYSNERFLADYKYKY